MEIVINKEGFSSENFNQKDYLNSLLSKIPEGQSSDILSFKLKITQRELSNEIELNSNNVIKSTKSITSDLKVVNALNTQLLEKISNLNSHQNIENNKL